MIAKPPALLKLAVVCAAMFTLACAAAAVAGNPKIKQPKAPSTDPRILWEPDTRVQRCERVAASRHIAGRVWVCTPAGIQESFDAGQTWKVIPNTAREQLGRITDIQFLPWNDQAILIASREKGVFRSDDNGKTWRNVGTPQTGLAAAQVVRLGVNGGDRNGRILYAAHGDAAAGLSKSIDGGQTWFSVGAKYFVYELAIDGNEILAATRSKDEDDIWSILQSVDGAENWTEFLRDVRPTVGAINRINAGCFWFGVLKGRIMFRAPLGRHQRTGDWKELGPDEPGDWSSIFSTFGDKPGEEFTFAYDPHKHGLLCSRDGFATYWSENTGLFVDPLIKDGANVTCAANGRTFYASINGQLYIGRLAAAPGPFIDSAAASPAMLRWTKGSPLTISARVTPGEKDAKAKVTDVRVDLSQLKGPGNFQLFDDGQHSDGAANDGVYAAVFTANEDFFNPWLDPAKRYGLPGSVLLTISARDAANRLVVDYLPFSAFPQPISFMFWNGEDAKNGDRMADGRRGSYGQNFDDRNGIIFDMAVEPHSGTRALHVVSLRGPWIVGWGSDGQGHNVSNHEALVFWIKSRQATTRDVKVVLTDAPGGENDASHSSEVWLIKDGLITQITPEYQRVRIPISKFMKKTGFMIEHTGGVAFGGDDPKGHDFFIDDIGFEAEGQPLK